MTIRVKGYLTLREVMENQEFVDLNYKPVSLQELLEALAYRFGRKFCENVFEQGTMNVCQYVKILVNGRHYNTLAEKLDTVIQDGDGVAMACAIEML